MFATVLISKAFKRLVEQLLISHFFKLFYITYYNFGVKLNPVAAYKETRANYLYCHEVSIDTRSFLDAGYRFIVLPNN